MTDLLNLPYWNVLKVQETDLNYVIDATYEPENAKTTTLRRGILRDQQAYYMFPPARPRPDYFSGVKISTLVTAIRNDHFLPISTLFRIAEKNSLVMRLFGGLGAVTHLHSKRLPNTLKFLLFTLFWFYSQQILIATG